MYEDIYKNLSDSLLYAFSPLIEQQAKLASNALNSISEALQESFYNLATYYNQNIAVDLANQIFALTSVMVSAIEIPSISLPALNFLKEIDFQSGYIELTEDDCDSINTLLNSSVASTDVPAKVSKGKINVVDFIKTVLIPVLALLLPMMQNSFYNKQASLESQKAQIQEQEYQAQILQTMSDMVNALESIQESLNSRSVSDSDTEESRYYLDDIQQTLDKVQDIVSEYCNTDSTVSDVHASSETDIHRE